ncbi:uncharacterized protein TrAFT101_008597 [Trichoderma asperellum]|uniref:Fe2OG dioxygenase domain-containing protein n=1 Tax=Trichoderma asperellum (strain ATCC 204424 / CBS 433.97 / NBRC 101777) TaxID=1042311 RepID=A0A2T3ZBX4_TRIA4|nr:hypothetical protein M441DRAFT_165426 [Trichoderma asperellum CBS 433.97]PTB42313.1 hypothetical protein M441DRAFT_165426 [Trichoderma asperellum CBS 433.97]UKZ93689.1 hypothetical protein TrAFT101_008597 [Trichoderma asperellum]
MAATADIPVIDISGDQDVVAQQLVDAAQEHGFIYIKNLGRDISRSSIDGAFALSKKLFDAPVEEKQACTINTNNRGWSGMHSETLDPKNQKVGDFKEAFNFGEFVDGKAQQPLPPTIASDEPEINAFADSCHKLCKKLLHLLGIGLGVGDFFSSAHGTNGESASILRLLRYPPPDQTAPSSDDIRAGAHSDYGSITLLFRLKGQAGLELQKKDGSWAPVPVCPPGSENDVSPPILINIGDLLSYWTNGLFRSTVHRVVFPSDNQASRVQGETSSAPRYSIAFFCHPKGTIPLEPVPSDRVKNFVPDESTPNQNPYAERKVMTANEHLFMRLKASYGTLYDEEP